MEVVKVTAKNGREMYFQVIDGKKKRISKEAALNVKVLKKELDKFSKVYTVEEAKAKKPSKGTIMVSGSLITEGDSLKQTISLCDGLLETFPPECGYSSIKFVMTAIKADKFLSDVCKKYKLLQVIEQKETEWSSSSGLKGVIYSDDSIVLKAGWDTNGKLKIMI